MYKNKLKVIVDGQTYIGIPVIDENGEMAVMVETGNAMDIALRKAQDGILVMPEPIRHWRAHLQKRVPTDETAASILIAVVPALSGGYRVEPVDPDLTEVVDPDAVYQKVEDAVAAAKKAMIYVYLRDRLFVQSAS